MPLSIIQNGLGGSLRVTVSAVMAFAVGCYLRMLTARATTRA